MGKDKRGKINGFDGIQGVETAKRMQQWNKNQPSGRWRRVKQIKVKYTHVIQTWYHFSKTFERKSICPFGMRTFVKKLMAEERTSNKVAIPMEVKEGLQLTDSNFDPADVKVTCEDEGDKGFGTFYVLYCDKCTSEKVPTDFVKRHSAHLPENPTITDLQDHWDEIVAADPHAAWCADVCGCLIPNEPSTLAGPNARRFILRPIDHANKHHKDIPKPTATKRPAPSVSGSVMVPAKINTIDIVEVGSSDSKQKVPKARSECTKRGFVAGKAADVFVKGGNWSQLTPDIGSMLDPSVSMFDPPKNDDEEFAQEHCLSVLLSGSKKTMSQAAILQTYSTSMSGIQKWHMLKTGNIEVDGKKFRKPPRVKVNPNNILRMQEGIVHTYKNLKSPTSLNAAPYAALTGSFGKFYSVFNDGIQKFCFELNGVMIRVLDHNFGIQNLPWALTNIPGGSMDHQKLVSQILSIIHQLNIFMLPGYVDAESEFLKLFRETFPDTIPPSGLPAIMRCTVLENCNFDNKVIDLIFDNWPVALVADGCGVNPKAGEKLVADFGLLSPTTRCSGHAASGSIRRLSTSKTMCVDEVVTFAAGLKPVLKHFKRSGRSSALLNLSLKVMEMKPLKAMVWCPSRMANLLQSSSRTVDILFPLSDVLTSADIKREESLYFLSPVSFSILHILADLEKAFVSKFLRKLDTDEATLFEVFGLTEKFVDSVKELETPALEKFISGLREDEHGNVIYEGEYLGDTHSVTLNYPHRPVRTGLNKVEVITKQCQSLKKKIVKNLIENSEDQNQAKTIVEYASAFDLHRKLDKSSRIEYLKELHLVYGNEYTHSVPVEARGSLEEYTMNIRYPPKLKCSEQDLLTEFNSIWPVVSKAWLKLKESKPESSRIRRFWMLIIEEHSIEYPNLADLLLLLLSVSPGTGPLERSFSKLAKVCYKDRGCMKPETLEVLYLLCTMDIQENDSDFLKKVCEWFQKK